MKFKVGNKVRILSGENKGKEVTVTNIMTGVPFPIYVDLGDGLRSLYTERELELIKEHKFKVGDKVKITKTNAKAGIHCIGQETEIIEITNNPLYPYEVKSNNFPWSDEELELITEERSTPMNRPEAWLWLLSQPEGTMCVRKSDGTHIRISDKELLMCNRDGSNPSILLACVCYDSEQWLPYTPRKRKEILLQEAVKIWENGGLVKLISENGVERLMNFNDANMQCFQYILNSKLYKEEE